MSSIFFIFGTEDLANASAQLFRLFRIRKQYSPTPARRLPRRSDGIICFGKSYRPASRRSPRDLGRGSSAS